jgi:endoglucanase
MTACSVAAPLLPAQTAGISASERTAAKLPRWRGFNLLEKFIKRRDGNPAFRETDIQVMQKWGFDFARLPISYHC